MILTIHEVTRIELHRVTEHKDDNGEPFYSTAITIMGAQPIVILLFSEDPSALRPVPLFPTS